MSMGVEGLTGEALLPEVVEQGPDMDEHLAVDDEVAVVESLSNSFYYGLVGDCAVRELPNDFPVDTIDVRNTLTPIFFLRKVNSGISNPRNFFNYLRHIPSINAL